MNGKTGENREMQLPAVPGEKAGLFMEYTPVKKFFDEMNEKEG
jgi:hypothetical protein